MSKISPYSKKKSSPKYRARKKAKIWAKYYSILRKKVLPKMELKKGKNLGKTLPYSKKKVLPKIELEKRQKFEQT